MNISPLRGSLQRYAWGSHEQSSTIHSILSQCASYSQESYPECVPEPPLAELWFGNHPNGRSQICVEGQWKSFDEKIEIPYLAKILSVAQVLSIQMHPNRTHAIELHTEAPEIYPDSSPKPEMAIALSPLKLLCGYKSWGEIVEILNAHPLFIELHSLLPALPSARSPIEATKLLFSLDKKVLASFGPSLEKITPSSAHDHIVRSAYTTLGAFDIGMFFAYFLEYHELKTGEAIFIPHSIPHAYVQGDLFECMLTSDNVVRAGLTPKVVDTVNFIRLVNCDQVSSVLNGTKRGQATYYDVPELPCKVVHIQGDLEELCIDIAKPKNLICLSLSDDLTLDIGDQNHVLGYGDAVYLDKAKSKPILRGKNTHAFLISA